VGQIRITIKHEYAKRYKIAGRTARIDLSDLVEKKLLYKRGETKSAKYLFYSHAE
jgi:Fic family protein